MITRDEIIDSIKFVVDNSKYVNINEERIKDIILILKEKKTAWLDSSFLDVDKYTNEQVILYMLICESLNFCY